MKDLRVEIRFKNNILYKKIFESYESVSDFCRKNDLYPAVVGEYLNLKNTPISKRADAHNTEFVDGFSVKKSALKIATALGCNVFDIFPGQLWDVVSKKYIMEVNSEILVPYHDNKKLLQIDSDRYIDYNIDGIVDVLESLEDRECDIIKKRFGIDGHKQATLRAIGKEYNIAPERIRQIEGKALRKLRHPTRSRKLRKTEAES